VLIFKQNLSRLFAGAILTGITKLQFWMKNILGASLPNVRFCTRSSYYDHTEVDAYVDKEELEFTVSSLFGSRVYTAWFEFMDYGLDCRGERQSLGL
jgi:hypothetical protein